jgi:hypothetical protein
LRWKGVYLSISHTGAWDEARVRWRGGRRL